MSAVLIAQHSKRAQRAKGHGTIMQDLQQMHEQHYQRMIANTEELQQRASAALENAQRQWLMNAAILAEKMERLAATLSNDAAQLREAVSERRIHKFVVNTLGVVQGNGLEIDLKCATLAASVEAIELLAHSVNAQSDMKTMLDYHAQTERDARCIGRSH